MKLIIYIYIDISNNLINELEVINRKGDQPNTQLFILLYWIGEFVTFLFHLSYI